MVHILTNLQSIVNMPAAGSAAASTSAHGTGVSVPAASAAAAYQPPPLVTPVADAIWGAGPPKKRQKTAPAEPKQPKLYEPRIGTANYAFLLCLFLVRGSTRGSRFCRHLL